MRHMLSPTIRGINHWDLSNLETKAIFLSYRRHDVPGYVGRLADHLDAAFGGAVFRDVDNIGGGADWKKAVSQAVSGAKIVLAIFGDRWQEILADRSNDDASTDLVRVELNLAHLLQIPVIPIVLDGTGFDLKADLGDLNWLKEFQFFKLSDRQNSWESDCEQLVQRVAQLTGLKPLKKDRNDHPGEVIKQTSHGDQSPNVVSGGDVTFNFGGKSK